MTDLDLFDDAEAEDDRPRFGPQFIAQYNSDDECCGDGLYAGQTIRANGEGGFIHASSHCEGLYR